METIKLDPSELKEWIDQEKVFTIVDVRSQDMFDAWRIEGRRPLETIHVPYFEIMEVGGQDDMVESVVAYGKEHWLGTISMDHPILAVCAKSMTSDLVAQGLRRLGYEAYSLAGGMGAWGDFYEFRPVENGEGSLSKADPLRIFQVSRPARGCLSYVVASGDQAIVIDPLRHTDQYIAFIQEQGLDVVGIFETHGHADHISGGIELARELGVPYYLHPYDAIHPIDVMPANLTYTPLAHGDRFNIGASKLEVIHVPGHTLGNLVFLLDDMYLFSGDTIFVESVARPDLGGRGEAWAPLHYRSLARLAELPGETIVLPGHFSSLQEADEKGIFQGRLADLRDQNEGLTALQDGEEAFVSYLLERLPYFPPQYVDIKRVNAGLLVADEERASELELGRNICALTDATG